MSHAAACLKLRGDVGRLVDDRAEQLAEAKELARDQRRERLEYRICGRGIHAVHRDDPVDPAVGDPGRELLASPTHLILEQPKLPETRELPR